MSTTFEPASDAASTCASPAPSSTSESERCYEQLTLCRKTGDARTAAQQGADSSANTIMKGPSSTSPRPLEGGAVKAATKEESTRKRAREDTEASRQKHQIMRQLYSCYEAGYIRLQRPSCC